MRYRERFCQEYNKKLEKFLIENHIRYDITTFLGRFPGLIIFNIYSDNPLAQKVKQQRFYKKSTINPLVYIEFTKKECLDALWLRMAPMHCKVEIINEDDAFAFTCRYSSTYEKGGEELDCAHHKYQISDFEVEKNFKWKGKANFWSLDTGLQELFMNLQTKTLIEEHALQGVEIRNFIQNKQPSNEIFQLWTENVLPREAIVLGYGEKEETCPMCGKKQYVVGTDYQLHLYAKYLDIKNDIYRTHHMFGSGKAYHFYIVSNRFYRLLLDNKMTRGACFEPVALHEFA